MSRQASISFEAQFRGYDADALILKAKSEGKLKAGREEWARQQIRSDRRGFLGWLENAPSLVACSDRQAGGRVLIINSAGAAYDEAPESFRRTFNRDAHIGGTLAEMGMQPLSDEERRLVSASGAQLRHSFLGGEVAAVNSERDQLIASHVRTYRANPDLVKVCNSMRSFVNGSLIAAGHTGLTDKEAAEYQLVG